MQFLLEVAKLINIVLTVLVTTATAEQTIFNIEMTQIISEIHCDPTTPNNLHTHKDITDKLDILQIAKGFVNINERRKLLWYVLIISVTGKAYHCYLINH